MADGGKGQNFEFADVISTSSLNETSNSANVADGQNVEQKFNKSSVNVVARDHIYNVYNVYVPGEECPVDQGVPGLPTAHPHSLETRVGSSVTRPYDRSSNPRRFRPVRQEITDPVEADGQAKNTKQIEKMNRGCAPQQPLLKSWWRIIVIVLIVAVLIVAVLIVVVISLDHLLQLGNQPTKCETSTRSTQATTAPTTEATTILTTTTARYVTPFNGTLPNVAITMTPSLALIATSLAASIFVNL